MMEIADVEEIFDYAKDNNWLSSIFYISIKQWPVAPFEPIDHYVDFLFGDNLYASEKLSEMTVDVLFEKMEVFIFRGSAMGKEYVEWKKSVIREWRISRVLQ